MSGVNERFAFQLIESQQATSQVQIAQHLNLPPNTVHGVVNRLLKGGVIRVDRVDRHGRGRPIQHYRVCRQGRVMAIQWWGSRWYAGIFQDNQAVGPIQKRNSPVLKNCDEALRMLREIHDGTVRAAGISRTDLEGVILSINAARMVGDRALDSSVLPWIRELSEEGASKALQTAVCLETEFSVVPFELRARAGEGIRSLVFFNVADGVSGHGIGLDRMWSASNPIRGELGHVVVDPNGPICGCGHRGCLEALISGPALLRRLENDVRNGVQTHLREMIGQSPAEFFARLEALDAAGADSYTRTIVQEFINRCAWAVSVIVNLIQPDVIVLAGYGLQGRAGWRERIRAAVQPFTLHGETTALRLEFPRLGPEDHLRHLAASFRPAALPRNDSGTGTEDRIKC